MTARKKKYFLIARRNIISFLKSEEYPLSSGDIENRQNLFTAFVWAQGKDISYFWFCFRFCIGKIFKTFVCEQTL